MRQDDTNRERRRQALQQFYELNKPHGLKSVLRWATISGLRESTIRQLFNGSRPKNMRSDTLEKLAAGASSLLNRPVSVSELTGAEHDDKPKNETIERILTLLEQLPAEALAREQQRIADAVELHRLRTTKRFMIRRLNSRLS